MSEHFIKEIEIKNYKLFKDFKASGFGRVNLIGGKNNVGKTALLEAIYLTNNYKDNLKHIVRARYAFDILNDLWNEAGKKYIENFIQNKIENIGEIKIETKTTSNLIYKSSNKAIKSQYEKYYSEIVKSELENRLDRYIKEFDNTIEKFRIINSEPHCKKDGTFLNLNELGDGLGSFIFFIMLILANRDAIILIDEIENGIHYTNFNKLWEIILTISKEQNVQVFATTHSKECIESFARVANKLNDDEIRFIEMGKNKRGEIKTIVLDRDRLNRDLEVGNEVRGW